MATIFVVLPRLLDQGFGEHLGIGRRRRLRFRLRAGRHVELDDAVILVGRFLGRLVAFALLGHDVDQERPILGVAHVGEHGQQVIDVVTVDRSHIEEAKLVEQCAAGDEAAGIFLHRHRPLLEERRQQLGEFPHAVAHRTVGPPGDPARQIARQRAHRRRNRHVVVIENDDQPRVHRAGIVHRLVSHAGRHRAVADHGDDVVGFAVEVARHRHAEGGRNRGRGMGSTERVILAFGPLGETGKPAALPQRANAVAPAGQDLVRIGLVADIPDQAVVRRVEHIV